MSTSNVTLDIAGRKYTIACAPGEERHIEELGVSISRKLTELDMLKGQSPDRVLLYAALLLADELHEAKSGAAKANEAAPSADTGHDTAQAEALENQAERLEALASRLESEAATS